TFAGAISQTAAGGEINCIDSGGFGALTINQAITVDGGGGVSSPLGGVTAPGINAFIINAASTDTVTLRNLDINGLGTGLSGISVLACKALHVENCTIYGFTTGIKVAPTANSIQIFLSNCLIRNNNISGGGGLA